MTASEKKIERMKRIAASADTNPKIMKAGNSQGEPILCAAGRMKAGDRVFNPNAGKREILNRIWRMHANTREKLDLAETGDIVAVVGLKETVTGHTLCAEHKQIILERLDFPQTVIVRLQNRVREDEETLTDLLNERARMHWNFDSLHHAGSGKIIVIFSRDA